MQTIKILLADDHNLFRQGIAQLISAQSDLEVVAEASNGAEAIDRAIESQPDLVLMDINMPGMPSFEAAREIKRQIPTAKVLFLTMHDDEDYLVESMEAGASGYVLKDTQAPQFLSALREVSKGGSFLSPRMLTQLVEDMRVRPKNGALRSRHESLSARERQVLKILAEGKSVKDIAAEFNLSVKTIEAHKFNLMRKLNIHNKAQLVQFAIAKKIIHLH